MHISKYNASGNDFVIFHTFIKEDYGTLAKRLCHRQKGIGADGLIVIYPHSEYDFEWGFYNSDGSEAEMCGNGSRAAAHYAKRYRLSGDAVRFLTQAGVIEAQIDAERVEVKLTTPKMLDKLIVSEGRKWSLIDTGVPHLVTFVDEIESFDKEVARTMRQQYNANVNFARVDPQTKTIQVRTYERGVEDETLACGTGMAAVFYSAYLEGDVPAQTKVYPTSKEELELRIVEDDIYFKGRVEEVFTTDIEV